MMLKCLKSMACLTRGGSVTTQIRFGEKVYSPSIDKGEGRYPCGF